MSLKFGDNYEAVLKKSQVEQLRKRRFYIGSLYSKANIENLIPCLYQIRLEKINAFSQEIFELYKCQHQSKVLLKGTFNHFKILKGKCNTLRYAKENWKFPYVGLVRTKKIQIVVLRYVVKKKCVEVALRPRVLRYEVVLHYKSS